MIKDDIAIRSIQHYLYCPHRWGLLEIDCAWAENVFVTKANLLHDRVHNPKASYSSSGKKCYTSVSVYNDKSEYNLYGVTDCIEVTGNENSNLCIVEYKPSKPKNKDYNFDDLMQVFAQKICVDYVFNCDCDGVLYYADVKKRIRPPLDPVNAVLSFVYTLYTNEYAAALETVGLDSYIGFCHALRSGRSSLACDLVEETRCLVERFVLTLINLKVITEKDFEKQISGAVWLNEDGRKKVLQRWQEKKRTDIVHPYLKQKIPFGLIPYVQSNIFAKYVRGDIKEYPCFLIK